MTTPALEVRDLTVECDRRAAAACALVDGVSLAVGKGEIVGLIGESGSGKTMTAMALLGMLPRNARIAGGSVRLAGRELTGLPERERRALRGDRMALVPQDALRGLNPLLRVGTQVGEPLNLHRGHDLGAAADAAVGLSTRSTSPSPPAAPTTTRTSSRAGCSSGR